MTEGKFDFTSQKWPTYLCVDNTSYLTGTMLGYAVKKKPLYAFPFWLINSLLWANRMWCNEEGVTRYKLLTTLKPPSFYDMCVDRRWSTGSFYILGWTVPHDLLYTKHDKKLVHELSLFALVTPGDSVFY